MIPSIFVSSTIIDLHHLRETIRDTVADLGYTPVMSEHGDVGYLPDMTAAESCFVTVNECRLAVLIVGKRYGSKESDGRSVTHHEFLSAKDGKIPVITLVDRDVLTFEQVYDASAPDACPVFPGMDSPEDIFLLLREIRSSRVNNGILAFDNASDARELLKKQLAHLFGDLLMKRFDPLKVQVQDILSEVKTLRHELLKDRGEDPKAYLRVMRCLLTDGQYGEYYRRLAEVMFSRLDEAVPIMLQNDTFDSFILESGYTFADWEDLEKDRRVLRMEHKIIFASHFLVEGLPLIDGNPQAGEISVLIDHQIILDENARFHYENVHNALLLAITGNVD